MQITIYTQDIYVCSTSYYCLKSLGVLKKTKGERIAVPV